MIGKTVLVLCTVAEWLAVVFGINSASNTGKKFIIVRDATELNYTFVIQLPQQTILLQINPNIVVIS